MDWQDEGTLLTVRPHGEGGAILSVLTAARGVHAGLVRGGAGRKLGPILQPGAHLALSWRGRLEEHLGTFVVEPIRSRAAAAMGDRAALAGLGAVTALAAFALPEREPDPAFYARTITVLDLLGTSGHWPYAYLLWEAALLERSGFGLDLGSCAVTGATEGLVHVSPRTGRAVTAAAAGAWAERLLPLTPSLRGEGPPADTGELLEGLRTTGWFLENRLRPHLGDRPLPPARARLVEALARR